MKNIFLILILCSVFSGCRHDDSCNLIYDSKTHTIVQVNDDKNENSSAVPESSTVLLMGVGISLLAFCKTLRKTI